jgi:hypothetical protein
MGPALNGKFNNVYADTDHYKKSSADPTYTGNWIRQMRTVICDHATTQFVRVQGLTTQTLPDLAGISNLVHVSMDTFLDRINNGKDL